MAGLSPTLPLAFTLALRFSRGRRRGGMVSLISIISTVGIALGVAVLIIGLSAMNGFERELKNHILAVVPHGELEPINRSFADSATLVAKLEQQPGIVGAAPYVTFTGLMENGAHLRAVQVKGVDPQQEQHVSALSRYVQGDAWKNFRSGEQQVILGKGVADGLGATVGTWVTVMIPNNDAQMKLLQPKRIRLQVSGILQLSGQLDHSLVLMPLADAQQELAMGNSVTGVAIKLQNPFTADSLVRHAAQLSDVDVYVKTWMSSYGFIYHDIQMIRAIMYLAMVLVIGVASFNIVSTLVMAVKDKSADIAVLRTLGAQNGLVRTIFIWYGLLAGLVGSLSGAVVGALVAWQLTPLIRLLETVTGHQFLSGDIYFIDFLPSELHLMDVLSVLATALILSLLASWYPAQRASRIDPARVLSGV